MRVLFVISTYLPSGSAQTGIVKRVAKQLFSSGVDVDILACKSKLNQRDFSIEDGIRVYRMPLWYAYPLSETSSPLTKLKIFIGKIINKFGVKLKEKSSRFYSKRLINLFFKGLNKTDIDSYDYVIPVCAYSEMYLAARKYKVTKHKDFKIIIYQLDPLTLNSTGSKKSYEKRLKLEKEMAHEYAVIASKILKKQKEELNISVDNVVTLDLPLIEENSSHQTQEKSETDEIKVIFSGYIYGGIRDPIYALNLFAGLNEKVMLYIVGGGMNELLREYEKKYPNIKVVGVLPLEEAKKWVDEADFLLNIGNNDINFVPSKIFEYIGTGKPIINTYKDKKCPTLEYFSKYDNCLCIYERDELEESRKTLTEFIKNNNKKRLKFNDIKKNFYENTVECVTKGIINVFNNAEQN